MSNYIVGTNIYEWSCVTQAETKCNLSNDQRRSKELLLGKHGVSKISGKLRYTCLQGIWQLRILCIWCHKCSGYNTSEWVKHTCYLLINQNLYCTIDELTADSQRNEQDGRVRNCNSQFACLLLCRIFDVTQQKGCLYDYH